MDFSPLRKDFPFFQKKTKKKLIYFDNAATTQKPRQMIDAVMDFYAYHTSNVFRSIHSQAEEATSRYEQARTTVANFIGAESSEVVFTSGATEGINFIAATWGEKYIEPGDEIVVTQMEHHANFLPWQQLALRKKATLVIVPTTDDGLLDMSAYENSLSHKTKVVAVPHVSNVFGTTNDVKKICSLAHAAGARVLIDASQSVPHKKLDVHDMGADFLVFSGHKMMGPTGIGVLYIAKNLAAHVPPYQFGGGMVAHVCHEESSWALAPHKFEAGTPPIAQAIGLAAAIDYLVQKVDFDALRAYEAMLCSRVIEGLKDIEAIRLLGPLEQLREEGHLVSFVVGEMHAHDVAAYLDGSEISVAVRAGQHCAQPLHTFLNIPASVRVSFYFYNTLEEVDDFLVKMKSLFYK